MRGWNGCTAAYGPRGFEVLGFPCNQFGGQEPGSGTEIAAFCQVRYAVTFPMFAKGDVNGSNAQLLFRYLKRERPGWLGFEAVKWNFTKFLVDREGTVVERLPPTATPAGTETKIVSLL